MRKPVTFMAGVLALAALVAAAFLTLRPQEPPRFDAAGLGMFSADEIGREAFRVAPAMLAVIYRAFAETDAAAIYDGLAEVATGDALEALYLERLGAMVGGGLDRSAEADQQIHEMELLTLDSSRTATGLQWDARWRVVGTVGHAEHMHVRGNTYAAVLTIAPVDGAWRLTGFDLTDVDRSDAGTMVVVGP